MKKLNIEYCHVTSGFDINREIKEANKWMPNVLKMFDSYEIQKCIMIDDVHAVKPVDKEFIKSLMDKLEIKPDCIYLESSFVKEAQRLVEKIDTKKIDFIYSNEKVWLKKNEEKYRSKKEFLLKWGKSGDVEFSCPTLAATSYLVRLGYLKEDGVELVYGDKVMVSENIVNVLSSQYLQVESNAQSIINVTFDGAVGKIFWFFY